MSRPRRRSISRKMDSPKQASDEVAKSLQQMKSMLNGDGGKCSRQLYTLGERLVAHASLPIVLRTFSSQSIILLSRNLKL